MKIIQAVSDGSVAFQANDPTVGKPDGMCYGVETISRDDD
jgi:hypothetical protein